MNKKVILFDLDGTLVDSIPVVLEAFREAFVEKNFPYPGDDIIKKEIGKHLEEIFADFVPKESVAEMVATYRKHYAPLQRAGRVQLIPKAKEALDLLHHKGIRMGIVTTKLRSFSEELLEQIGVLHFFEVIIGAEDVQKCKPDPEPLFAAVKKMGVKVEDAVYIGDSTHDAEAATAAGVEFYGVKTGGATEEELEKYGKVFENVYSFASSYL